MTKIVHLVMRSGGIIIMSGVGRIVSGRCMTTLYVGQRFYSWDASEITHCSVYTGRF